MVPSVNVVVENDAGADPHDPPHRQRQLGGARRRDRPRRVHGASRQSARPSRRPASTARSPASSASTPTPSTSSSTPATARPGRSSRFSSPRRLIGGKPTPSSESTEVALGRARPAGRPADGPLDAATDRPLPRAALDALLRLNAAPDVAPAPSGSHTSTAAPTCESTDEPRDRPVANQDLRDPVVHSRRYAVDRRTHVAVRQRFQQL